MKLKQSSNTKKPSSILQKPSYHMKTKFVPLILAVLAGGWSNLSSVQAQTTNFVVNEFNSAAEVTNGVPWNGANNGWGNWYGNDFVSVQWDPTSDSSGNPHSGSMLVTLDNSDQYVLFDGFFTFGVSAVNFTNLQFDVRYDASSAIRTNGDGSIDFGFVQVGCWNQYNQDYFGSFAIPATNAAGKPNTNWTRINIPLNAVTDPVQTNITDVLFHAYHPGYGNQDMVGATKYWLDNIQFVGASAVSNPPPTLTVSAATPALRIFASEGEYNREDLATTDGNASWVGGTYPVSYSFTLSGFPNCATYQGYQFAMFLIPSAYLPYGPYDNSYADWDSTNDLWVQIMGNATNYYANVAWKTGLPGANPNNTVAKLYTGSAVGTWKLTFSDATDGVLTAPDGTSAPFSLPLAMTAQFANPLVAYFGIEANTTGNVGQYVDVSKITVSGTAGQAVSDNFATDSSLNSGTWNQLGSSSAAVLATSDTPWWISWTLPDFGFDLGTKASLSDTVTPWYNPGYYSGYFSTPIVNQEGTIKWALIPSECLPSNTNAFFLLQNPPIYE
jgi:hypothetical protein